MNMTVHSLSIASLPMAQPSDYLALFAVQCLGGHDYSERYWPSRTTNHVDCRPPRVSVFTISCQEGASSQKSGTRIRLNSSGCGKRRRLLIFPPNFLSI